jgi:hypothetical protein
MRNNRKASKDAFPHFYNQELLYILQMVPIFIDISTNLSYTVLLLTIAIKIFSMKGGEYKQTAFLQIG